jgi:mono/diheme cytochrome c family protein
MNPLLKAVFFLLGFFLLLAVGGVISIFVRFPDVGPASDLEVTATPQKIARGRYLATHVSLCLDCHSQRDFSLFAGPVANNTLGMGGDRFDHAMGLPGVIHASNITPAALGTWTDGEIMRAFTEGVSRDGQALFPLMPYPHYGRMAVEDAEAIIAFLRTLPPIENGIPVTELDFPMNIITRTIPRVAQPRPVPDPADEVTYGQYLTTIAACEACHTPMDGGQPDPNRAFAGGHAYFIPGGVVQAANITPHADTGIGGWTRAQFIARFQSMAGVRTPASPGTFNTVMPWTGYAGMTGQDLGAIFAYLQTVRPVSTEVVRFVAEN